MPLIAAHPVVAVVIGYVLLNAFVAGMPAPTPASSLGYRWLHGSLNALAMNILEVARARYPHIPLSNPPALERPTT